MHSNLKANKLSRDEKETTMPSVSPEDQLLAPNQETVAIDNSTVGASSSIAAQNPTKGPLGARRHTD